MKSLIAAEFTKIWSLRSSYVTLVLTLLVTLGFEGLIVLSAQLNSRGEARSTADLLFGTFYSIVQGQLPLVVFAVLMMSGEYSSGTIRASLSAIPRRGAFLAGKVAAVGLVALVVGAVTVAGTVLVAMAGFGVRPDTPDLAATAVRAILYLVLISLFAVGVAGMLRSPIWTLAVLMPVFFLGAQGFGNIPKAKEVLQWLPDQAGMVALHIVGQSTAPQFERPYGPWAGLGLLALWTAASLLGAYAVLRRKDA
jgi:ABC-2 type transport system permease protein